ncbi:Integration host factor subunit beta [Candidatus Bealeia paramacronuclearis]|uniref:Integration host factor subunit beta n=1 Tax=Candidatus Bealeia paramacronuclearis TaxID=1921001 RepID=A0ABZ2C2A1_9PROT|nr:Integration host factor subunit beta [Candidatus Bealeia paramacronuclearis]
MTRSDLVEKLSEKFSSLTKRDVEQAVDIIFDEISTTLAKGGRVELRGFGAFSVRKREGRMGRNPRTGETVTVPAKSVPFFKAGKGLKDRLNQK